MAEFVHLHLHTQYSLLDGANKIDDIFKRITELKMPAVAITDHGNLFGVINFYKNALKNGVKPIIGCEVYVAPKSRKIKTERTSYHLVLLSKNDIGYKNLLYLVSMSYLEGFYYNPRIDKEILKEYSQGLIGLSACMGGEIPQAILQKNLELAKSTALEYENIFGKGNFYLEIQENGIKEQQIINEGILQISKETGIPLVATNDCHYLDKEDAENHDILLCIQTGKLITDKDRLRHETDGLYIKSEEEMIESFKYAPESIENAIKISKECNVNLELGKKYYLPTYQVPHGFTPESYLSKLASEGLEERFREMTIPFDKDFYKKRLESELEIIIKMGFASYFLIVWDFIHFAKKNGIPVGPGRGSGAGSLVAYALKITNINPIPYNLLFERFLNPERVSMPDFDIDFCMERRNEVIEYVKKKYGKNNVAQIITFGSLKARGVIRDVGRAMNLTQKEVDKIAKLVPDVLNITLEDALAQEPLLKEECKNKPEIKKLFDVAQSLEGLNRHAGVHAAGIVISDKPLWEHVPLFKGNDGEIVTQFAKDEIEEIGLVKFDFLGLKTLTLIKNTVDLINKNKKREKFSIDNIPLDDPQVYELLSSGMTDGVFQLESSGFKELLKKLKPDCFEDIIAAVALYRPGPLNAGMVDSYIKGKHKEIEVTYPHPLLEDILKETYGVIVYQEQVMQIASVLAGFTMGQADLLRRAMGKKKQDVMEQQRNIFIESCAQRGIDPKIAFEVFETMSFFAGYGFNKSHSAAYALLTYQTAYLKKYYPVEFMAALLTSEKENTENVAYYISKCKEMGIEILPPDINESDLDFSVTSGNKIRFGLAAIKNVGIQAISSIISSRNNQGKYLSIYNFCERVDLNKVNKKVIESLIKSGAFDSIIPSRAYHMAVIDKAMSFGQSLQKDKKNGQLNLFGSSSQQEKTLTNSNNLQTLDVEFEEWSDKERLSYEKELLGFYVTGHPLFRYIDIFKQYTNANTITINTLPNNYELSIAGIITSVREKITSRGEKMAYITLEDIEGSINAILWPEVLQNYLNEIKGDTPVLIKGYIQLKEERRDIIVKEVIPFYNLLIDNKYKLHLKLYSDLISEEKIEKFKKIINNYKGNSYIYFHIFIPEEFKATIMLPESMGVLLCDSLIDDIERLFGKESIYLKQEEIL